MLIEIFRDDEEDCYGYCTKINKLYSLPVEDLVKILIEINCVSDDILHIIKEKLNEA